MISSSDRAHIVISMIICFNVGELVCYLTFFCHVFRNDNGRIKMMLPAQVTRQRNRANVISFLGDFYGFVTKFAFFVVFGIIASIWVPADVSHTTRMVMEMIVVMEWGLLSSVEVLTSDELRRMMFADIDNIRFLLSWL